MITKFLPTFKAVEVNNLVGLRSGHVIAQSPASSSITVVSTNGGKFIENGLILGLGTDGTLGNYDASAHGQPLLHYTEELNTFLNELKYFAVPVEKNAAGNDDFASTYVRAIGLYVGDAFTTDNYVAGAVTGDGYAKVVNGTLTLQAAADSDTMFIAKKTTMPVGTVGYEFTYIKG